MYGNTLHLSLAVCALYLLFAIDVYWGTATMHNFFYLIRTF